MLSVVISHNLMAQNANRQLNIITKKKAKNTEKLSSGYRINRSADDAAGLAISEKMRWQIRGLDRASKNIEDGISFVQTGEGALNEVHDMLHRMKELAVQASNDTNTDTDRAQIDTEIQQIKSEAQRIFDTTQFNGIYIFKAPYIPSVESEPDDYKLFNIGNSSTSGGVVINSKRYTWDELGVPETAGDDGWHKSFSDTNGELIELSLAPNAARSELHRVYQMSADDTGIYINNMLAGTWGGTIDQNGLEYSFSYHGMDLSFTVDEGATREEIISRLNPDGISSISWDAIPSGGHNSSAVTSTRDDFMRIDVTNANKDDIKNWKYSVTADDEGVTITHSGNTVSDGITHKKILWENFSNTGAGEAYPIVDWGTTSPNPQAQDSTSTNPVTLDNAATYHYADTTNDKMPDAITFDFNFPLDEVSKAEAIRGLTQNLTDNGIKAPISSVVTNASNVSVTGYSNINFDFQKDQLLREFGSSGSDSPMTVTIKRELVSDHSYVHVYQSRSHVEKAYLNQLTDTQSTVKTYTGEVLVTGDAEGHETESEQVDSYTLTDTQTGDITTTSTGKIEYTDQDPEMTSSHTSSDTSDKTIGDEIAGSRIVNDDGTYSYKKTITYTVTDTVTTDYFEHRNGNTAIYDNSGNYHNVDTLYCYTRGYDVNDPTLVRTDNGIVYHEATDADDEQHYFKSGNHSVIDKTYNLNKYKYTMLNSAGDEIATYTSDYFISTGSDDILDGASDYNADRNYAANPRSSQALPSENIVDSLTIAHGAVYYAGVRSTDARNQSFTTDLAARNVNFTKSYNGQTTSFSLRYDDRADGEDRDQPSTTTMTITPAGEAYHSYSKPARSAGSATAKNLKIKVNPPEKLLHIQSGALAYQDIPIKWTALSNSIIGISTIKTRTYDQSQAAMANIDEATDHISRVRAHFGAYQNRMEHAMAINDYTSENTQAAESRIRDTNMAKESVEFNKHAILQQAGSSVLTQANQSPNGVLQLLQ